MVHPPRVVCNPPIRMGCDHLVELVKCLLGERAFAHDRRNAPAGGNLVDVSSRRFDPGPPRVLIFVSQFGEERDGAVVLVVIHTVSPVRRRRRVVGRVRSQLPFHLPQKLVQFRRRERRDPSLGMVITTSTCFRCVDGDQRPGCIIRRRLCHGDELIDRHVFEVLQAAVRPAHLEQRDNRRLAQAEMDPWVALPAVAVAAVTLAKLLATIGQRRHPRADGVSIDTGRRVRDKLDRQPVVVMR